jgi:hypothetical protein
MFMVTPRELARMAIEFRARQGGGPDFPMPHFFFHLFDDMVTRDEEGKTLPDEAAARDYALHNIRELICDDAKKGRINLAHWIEIADEQGQEVATVRFSEAVIIEG